MAGSSPVWDTHDLIRRLCQVLETAERTVCLLGSSGYTDEREPASGVEAEKVVAEAALLLLAVADAVDDAEVLERVRRIARHLLPLARSRQVRVRLCLQPALAVDHASAHACLSRLGFVDEQFDRLYMASLAAASAGAQERLPYRDLEQEWLRRVWNPGATRMREDGSLARRSILGRGVDALSPGRDEAYAFTHAVLYLTDLGGRTPRLPRSGAAIAADAEALLAHALRDQDYDVGAELLLTWPLLRRRWSPSAAFGFHVLAWVEDRAGFLPSPFTRIDRYRSLEGEDRSRYLLASAYHTAFVMGLLCAAALRPGCAPPAAVPVTRRSPGAASALLALLDEHPAEAHWRTCIDTLPPGARDNLAPLLLCMVLQDAVGRYDLVAVQRAIQAAVRHGLETVPAFRQAVQLIHRIETLNLGVRAAGA